MRSLKDKVFVVTGAGGGIGSELVQTLAREGAVVAANDVSAASLEQAALAGAPFQDRVFCDVLDVTDYDGALAYAAAVRQRHGRIDGLINNAGVTLKPHTFNDINADLFRRVMEVNFWGVVNCTRAILPHLIEAEESSLVNLSSVGGLVGLGLYTEYASAKWAVRGFSECLRSEFHGTGLSVTSVHPGAIRTQIPYHALDIDEAERKRIAARLNTPGQGTPPKEAAQAIVAGIKSKRSRVLIGGDSRMMDRIARYFPNNYAAMIAKPMRRMIGV